jgi:hypothetical protein
MSRTPLLGVVSPDLGTDGIGDILDAPKTFGPDNGVGGVCTLRIAPEEWKLGLSTNVISKLKMTSTTRVKIANIPIKGTMADFTVGLEEFINLFPGC